MIVPGYHVAEFYDPRAARDTRPGIERAQVAANELDRVSRKGWREFLADVEVFAASNGVRITLRRVP